MGNNEELLKIASRIISIDIYEARNNDITPETLARELENYDFCIETIKYLLSVIEEAAEIEKS